MLDKLILREAKSISDWLVTVRRNFHMHPELGLEEFDTQQKIVSYLKDMQIPYISPVAKTGVVGLIGKKVDGRTIALRADMDALPIEDKKDVEYKSLVKGKMHACGHDVHMTVLLGAAKLLKSMENDINGNVKLIFQPAEETVGGAKTMIEEGVLNNPKVDTVLGLHVSAELDAGSIGVKYGQSNAASDTIKIIIHGKSSHGARPYLGVDAISIAGQVLTTLQTVVSRNVDPRSSAVVTIGVIRGGEQGNIIADKVEMAGTVRTLNNSTRENVLIRVKEIVEGISEAMGGKGEFIREEGYAPVVNHNDIVKVVEENGKKLLGKTNVKLIELPSYGVEDFGYFIEKTPGAFFYLGARNKEKGIIKDVHNSLFDVDEKCLHIGVAMQVLNVLSLLSK
ncbi:M20 metallopeptidase family protein [Serpentinicella alkaliphila]|uniref:Amidohydrolase n=1 Tax=Serpentinicella alkaliphila TaxID=1734049 RepID=A0A4R2TWX5_9FIRM|nr:M20 family metallopeptidase [Serpentinicella alkaliphila]QUH25506.1 amidohydrolase [Serpentinicella alkaliphila]TCP99692.1 amidohydrolase [Serpentinicella alkaliphila]